MAKILYIEDNETNRDMLSRRLELEGHEVLLAEDGPSGLLRARQDRPDLILLDMSLPGMDGWELAAQLRAEAGARRVPLVALTAHAMPGDRERCLAAGCDDYDTKPVDVARLLAKIEAHLGRAAHPTPLSPAPPEPAEPEIARPTLLLVEDDDLSRDFLSRRIGMEGYVVETAADGPAALARLEERDFDLVLLDVMPWPVRPVRLEASAGAGTWSSGPSSWSPPAIAARTS
ncbi:response regulator [bacterium]|nr:response regulator [bacterium]